MGRRACGKRSTRAAISSGTALRANVQDAFSQPMIGSSVNVGSILLAVSISVRGVMAASYKSAQVVDCADASCHTVTAHVEQDPLPPCAFSI